MVTTPDTATPSALDDATEGSDSWLDSDPWTQSKPTPGPGQYPKMKIQRRNNGKGHTYVDTLTGTRVPGVTTIVNKGLPKEALINWAVNSTIDYALDNWDSLSADPISVRIKRLQQARWEATNEAARKGTQVHRLGERLVEGHEVRVPEGLEGYVEAYVRFLDDFDVQPVLVERTVVHHQHRYCGTFDLAAYLIDEEDSETDLELVRRNLWLLDLKTGKKSGIFGDVALQLAPYRYADAYLDDAGDEQPMPEFDRTGVVHIMPNGYDLVPVTAEELQFRHFLYVQQTGGFLEGSRDLVGEPIIPPRTSTFRLERT